MKAQIIEKNGVPEWAVVPYSEYLRLVEAAELMDDVAAFDAAVDRTREEETVPHELVKRLVAGENPIRVWRRHRGLTQERLAGAAGIAKAYLSQIERGKRVGSPRVLSSLARVLGISVEDILPE